MKASAASPMKILMNTDTLGGVWTYSLALVRQITSRGHRVALVTAGKPLSPEQRHAVVGIRLLDVFETRFRLEWMRDGWDDVDAMGARLLEIADSFEPDVVHLNDYSHGSLPWTAPVVVVGHSCVLSWFAAVRRQAAGAEWDEYRRRVGEGLQRADLVVAPTRWMLDELQTFYGPLLRERVVPNGHDAPLAVRGGKQPAIFSAGRLWDEAKNVANLCAAAPSLRWPVWIAGDARRPGARETEPESEPLMNVRMLGFISPDRMRVCYEKASIYALPALYEPFGLTALEAAGSACALVLADLPSLRETWGDAAVYVEPGEPAEWVRAIGQLISDDNLRRGLASAAFNRSRRYTTARMAGAYLQAYGELQTGAPHVVASTLEPTRESVRCDS